MAGFIEGADRAQTTLLPECLDDWVEESNPVRFIDAFVDGGSRPCLDDGFLCTVTAKLLKPYEIDPLQT